MNTIEKCNVSTVIITYNGMQRNWIQKCFDSLINSSIPIDIIAIDNGSTDGSIEYIRKHYSNVDFVVSNINLGFGKANNLGIRKALDNGADYVFLLNQDAWVEQNTIESLISIMQTHPEYGILSPIQLNGKGTDLDKNFEINMNTNNCPDFISHCYLSKLKYVYPLKFVMAAFWLLNRETINRIGLFNPVFPHYGEDNDYLNRVEYHGLKAGICPRVVGYHDRDERMVTNKRKIHFLYIDLLVSLNDINLNYFKSFLKSFLVFIKYAISSIVTLRIKNLMCHSQYYYSLVFCNSIKSWRARVNNKRPVAGIW